MSPSILFDIREASAYLGSKFNLRVSPKTLRSWRCQGKGPKSRLKIGRIYYSQADLDQWASQEDES